MVKALAISLLGLTVIAVQVAGDCTTKTAVNGPFDGYLGTSTVADVSACKAACLNTAGCTVFKFCDSTDACKNYWSRGGPDDPKGACVLGKGSFSPRAPNDWTVTGFTVGECTAGGVTTKPAIGTPGPLASGLSKNLKGDVFATSTVDNVEACAAACYGNPACTGYNFCASLPCGETQRGQCDLKSFSGAADYWADSSPVAGDGWVSGVRA